MPIPRVNMLKSVSRKSWLAVILVLGLLGLTLFDWDEWAFGPGGAEKVALAQVPAPVRAAIEREAQGGSVKEIEKATFDGKTAYAASVVVNGSEHEALIGDDGKVLSRGAAEKDGDD